MGFPKKKPSSSESESEDEEQGSRILPAPSPRRLQPPAAGLLPARASGVPSGDGAEAKAESEESEAVEDTSWPRLQVSEQKRRPRRQVRGCPRSGLRHRLQQKQAARECQCSPWCVTSSPSAPAGTATGLARLGKEALEAAPAAGPAAPHHVALPPQGLVALQAAEVLQVPAPALGLDALLHEDQLQGENSLLEP
ncbi:uncharacterized protein FYW23_012118 isoform 1-T4 [Sylvia borin]